MTKEIFLERHYFLRLQQQFPESGGHMPPSPPRFLWHCCVTVLTDPTTSTCPVFGAGGAPDCFVQVHQSLICLLTSLCNHQEIINRRLEQICKLSSDTRLEWPGRYSSRTQINAAGQNGATIRITSWAIIKVRPAALGQMWHQPGNHK